jgi:Putative Ig domain
MPSLAAGSGHRGESQLAFTTARRTSTGRRIALLLMGAFFLISCGLQAQGESSGGHLTLSATLSAATVGIPYNAVVSVSGGSVPYHFAISRGKLPPGITLNEHSGTISGTPLTAGSYYFTVFVTDRPNADQGDHRFTMVAASSSDGGGVSMAISPTSASVASTGKQQFIAMVSGTSNTAVTWSTSAGTISSAGLFTAPSVASSQSVTVTATSSADASKQASASVIVSPNLVMVAVSPAAASIVSGGTQQFTATVGGTSNVGASWSATAGTVSNSGLFTAPTVTLATTVTVTATSLADPTKAASAIVSVNPPGFPPPPTPPPPQPPPQGADNRYCDPGNAPNFGSNDGPAVMPAACFYTALAGTPSAGAVTPVPAGSSVLTALNQASCGDTLVLQAGQTYSGFTLPAKNCDAGHYITIVSSGVNSGVLSEGTRATPCYAGVSSLPGRPNLNCTSTTNVMATIAGATGQNRIIDNTAGASYYRLIGLEVADTGANGSLGGYYDLVKLNNADHIILDRCWIHGSPLGEDVKGVDFENSQYIAVIDSTITDVHSKTTGYGADASAIGSVAGTGPVKIVNNFLEGSGQTLLWGGGSSSTNVTDIEFRRNHSFKPLTWRVGDPNYIGVTFVVKNHFENKSGVRELVEGNIFENSWAQAQKGTLVLLYAKNQYGKCPGCTVHDVTIRYNILRHASNGIVMSLTNATSCATGATPPCSYAPGPMYNFSLHDNIMDDLNDHVWVSPTDCCTGGWAFELTMDQQTTNWIHDVTVVHNTAFPTRAAFNVIMAGPPETYANFTFMNNMVQMGLQQLLLGGGTPGCNGGSGSGVIKILNGCMGSTWQFAANMLAVASGSAPNQPYPSGNYLSTWPLVGLVNYNNGNGGDYHLLSTSPYKNAGTDGKDLGADVDGVLAATAGVL